MSTIIIAQENNFAAPACFFENIFRLRHETFLERLQWNIETNDGMERDNFDDLGPYHIAVQNTQAGIDGCWRALPTTGSYMLKDVFPELLQGEAAPTEANVWEISRFAVRKGTASSLKGYMSGITIQMVNSFYEFAQILP
jgi:acyl homoserine lactone synthase